jgi:hypothetical protein
MKTIGTVLVAAFAADEGQGKPMRRREFITLFGSAAAWVSLARAQEPRRVIGYLASSSPDSASMVVAPFILGLKDTGFIEGKDLRIEWRRGTFSNDDGHAAADQFSRQRGQTVVLTLCPTSTWRVLGCSVE